MAGAQAAPCRRACARRLRDAGAAAVARARRYGAARHFDRPANTVAAVRRIRAGMRRPASRDQHACRRDGQCRLTEADRRHFVRQARPARRHQDQDRPVGDRRAHARRACRAGPPAAAKNPRLAPGVEIEIDLYRRAARLRQPDHASRAYELRACLDHHRAAVVVGTEFAEHPDPHRGRQKNPPRLHRRARPQARLRRLFADRAAAARRDRRDRAIAQGIPRGPRHPRHDGVGNVRRAGQEHAGRGSPASESDQFRHRLRHFRFRARQSARHRA